MKKCPLLFHLQQEEKVDPLSHFSLCLWVLIILKTPLDQHLYHKTRAKAIWKPLLKAFSFRTRVQTITYSQIQPHDLLWPLAPCNPHSQQCQPQQFWDSDLAILLLPANNRNEVGPHSSMENRIMFLWNACFDVSNYYMSCTYMEHCFWTYYPLHLENYWFSGEQLIWKQKHLALKAQSHQFRPDLYLAPFRLFADWWWPDLFECGLPSTHS